MHEKKLMRLNDIKYLGVLALCFLSVSALRAQNASSNPLVFDLTGDLVGRSELRKDDLRLYFLQTWSHNTRTKIVVLTATKEGEVVTSEFYVEEYRVGRWRIREETRSPCPYISEKTCSREKPVQTIYKKIDFIKTGPGEKFIVLMLGKNRYRVF